MLLTFTSWQERLLTWGALSDYVYSPPKLADITLLLESADFYRAQRYSDFCTKYILDLIPDRMPGAEPANIPLLVKGVTLGREYGALSAILRPAFYGLARTKTADDESEDYPCQYVNCNDLRDDSDNETVNGHAKRPFSPMEKLQKRDLVILLDIQQRLIFGWNRIMGILDSKCDTALCQKRHQGKVEDIRSGLFLDPIRGVDMILSSPNIFATAYCAESRKKVSELLRKEQIDIWDCVSYWVDQ